MKELQATKFVAYALFALVTMIEIVVFYIWYDAIIYKINFAGPGDIINWVKLLTVSGVVLTFNISIWFLRKVYDCVKQHYEENDVHK